MFLKMSILKNFAIFIERVLLNRAPTSTQLHPPPPSSLQHPQQYLNQNIARNWAISPNLDQKIKSFPFWLKIGTHGILQMLIPNPDFDFWNSDPKIHFWANLGPKIQSCPFCLKIGTHGISRMLILIPTLVFWISNSNFLFGQIWAKKVKVVENWRPWHLDDADSYSNISFLNFRPQIHFWANLGQKSQNCPVWLKIGTQSVLTMLILIPTLFF